MTSLYLLVRVSVVWSLVVSVVWSLASITLARVKATVVLGLCFCKVCFFSSLLSAV